ncbi:MAG: type II toxin-antitoxin system VapC family toxin [Ilumatobacteraceae bacterium]|nr:type II toxin-antitoxin system VapC family toxin [Ilumatobacter sp.]MCB0983738.1 type II toxin-antitoxin system VapC family toxin [Ilumatobacter sp.]
MTRVVIDASAGAEIVTATARGRALARVLPSDAELWVPEHFYVEVLGVLRHQSVIARTISPDRAELAVDRLRRWHLRQAAVAPLVLAAWSRRHNMSAADAVYVALAEQVGAALLTDDHRLTGAPTFPMNVAVLQLPLR